MDRVKVFYIMLVLILINNSTEVSSDTNCGLENAKSGKQNCLFWHISAKFDSLMKIEKTKGCFSQI